jgi:cell surface protein SprA
MSMPLNSSLIRGAQSLFGVKTQLQFGKQQLRVFFRAKSQTKSLVAQGGGTIQDFDMFALIMIEVAHEKRTKDTDNFLLSL